MSRRRLLFVDDEPQVLTLLQSMFRHVSPDWDSVVTNRGEEALALMANQPFDVVVTDMQMPEMTGARLLERVRDQYPGTTRVVLSGYPDSQLSIQSMGAAHQYLAKPFRVEDVQAIVERAGQLEARVPDPRLRAGLSGLSTLPVAPTIWQRFERELASPTVSAESLGGLVAQDPGLTLKILQAAHSAFFGTPHRALLAKEATRKLGVGLLRGLVAAKRLGAIPVQAEVAGLAIERLARHSVATGLHASRILSMEGATPDAVKLGFTGGVLHDIGRLALASAVPEAYDEVVRRVLAGGVTLLEVERAVLGTDHARAGAYLMGLWGLPQGLVDVAAHHHWPAAVGGGAPSPLAAVYVANHVQRGLAGWPDGASGALELDALQAMGADVQRVKRWLGLGADAGSDLKS
jgi:HD-like signal output (HDOD) protein